jgi:hypothetical protein
MCYDPKHNKELANLFLWEFSQIKKSPLTQDRSENMIEAIFACLIGVISLAARAYSTYHILRRE